MYIAASDGASEVRGALWRGTRGAILPETLIAFVLLAIGMLGVQAICVGALRMAARAERLADIQSLAVTQMEDALAAHARGELPRDTGGAWGPTRWTRTAAARGRETVVRVTVRPRGDAVLRAADSVVVVSHAFR